MGGWHDVRGWALAGCDKAQAVGTPQAPAPRPTGAGRWLSAAGPGRSGYRVRQLLRQPVLGEDPLASLRPPSQQPLDAKGCAMTGRFCECVRVPVAELPRILRSRPSGGQRLLTSRCWRPSSIAGPHRASSSRWRTVTEKRCWRTSRSQSDAAIPPPVDHRPSMSSNRPPGRRRSRCLSTNRRCCQC